MFKLDYTVIDITLRSIYISGLAAILASIWSIPLGILLSISRTRYSKLLVSIFNMMIGLPTVLIGLLLYLILSRSGPLGFLNLLYTPTAIIVGQAILITPLIISLVYEVVAGESIELIEMLKTYGADKWKIIETLIEEARDRIIGTSVIGFERALGELGIALMLGGNIKGLTRVFTTSIALEVQKGEFELAIQLGFILLVIDLLLIILIRLIGWRR